MTESQEAVPTVAAAGEVEQLWFLGTLVQVKLDGASTGGRLGVFEGVLPRGASPPLHSHPQDETFYVLDGDVTVWVDGTPRRLGRGDMAFAPRGAPHSFRVESDTARLLVISTAAGIEAYVRALAEPARWPWLQPPPDGPRVAPERLAAVDAEYGVTRHGPPPD